MKRWYASKTIWVNVLAALCLAIQAKWGFVIDAEAQGAILIVINVILRGVTKDAITLALLLSLAGCSTIYDKYGQYEGSLSCKGKGSLTGNGSLSIGAGYGGSGTNAWTVQGDCGEGFSIERHRERDRTEPTPAPPVKP